MIKTEQNISFFSQNNFPTLKMVSSVLVMAVDIFHAPVPNSMENRKGLLKEAFCYVRRQKQHQEAQGAFSRGLFSLEMTLRFLNIVLTMYTEEPCTNSKVYSQNMDGICLVLDFTLQGVQLPILQK